MASTYIQTKKRTNKSCKSVELPYGISDINDLLEEKEDEWEVEIVQSIRMKPKHTRVQNSEFEIDFSAIRVNRVKPSI